MPPEPLPTTNPPHGAPRYAWSIPGWESERPSGDPDASELWAYTDRFSYDAGERVGVHVHTTAVSYDLEVVRDGAAPTVVHRRTGLPGASHPTPDDAYAVGCGWPEAFAIEVDPAWSSGFYLVRLRAAGPDGRLLEYEHFFVVRAPVAGDKRLCLVLTTSTLLAYNDWGGANHYRGLGDDPSIDVPSPHSSTQRPLARGFLSKPVGAPRNLHTDDPPPGWEPRHATYEWAHANGYGRHHADALWATYERPFVVWAEQQGYQLDYLTQHDLHERPERLDGYGAVVLVGHDEYWSWEMRDAIDDFVDGGGNVARFAGNYVWQVRLEDDGRRQVCFKDPSADPVRTDDPSRVTTAWDSLGVGRPGAATMGLTGLGGAYSRYGATTPRSSGGYTVYRPEHWALEGTDLYYGDVFGAAPICVMAFEVDGVEYTFRDGLPEPTFVDGAPESLEIVAMAPAVVGEPDRWSGRVPLGAPADEFAVMVAAMGEDAPAHLRGKQRGAGMVATFSRGAGTVFNAGTTEWVSGLMARDPFTERITHNVLRRLGVRAEAVR